MASKWIMIEKEVLIEIKLIIRERSYEVMMKKEVVMYNKGWLRNE